MLLKKEEPISTGECQSLETEESVSENSEEQRTDMFEGFMKHSTLYREFLAEKEEILRHRGLESERAGEDIGFERALLDWIRNHREKWRTARSETSPNEPSACNKSGN